MLHFKVFHNNEHIKTYEINNSCITIGRLPENDIAIASISVSRRHNRIEQDPTRQYILTDLNSLNGTYVNNQKISITKLMDGDKITIGKYSILFEIIPEESELNETAVLKNQKSTIANSTANSPLSKETHNVSNEIQKNIPTDTNLNVPMLIETNKHVIYKIDKPIMSIGSSENDDIFVEGFLITDGHVLVEKDSEGLWIHANKLMGRVKINGKKENKYKLNHKDKIEIGSSIFRYMENG